MTPEWLTEAIAYGAPVLELCLAVLLILGVITRLAAAVSAALYVVLLIGLVLAAGRGIKLDCGCFGGGGSATGSTHYTLDILRDVGLLILALLLVVWPMTQLSVDWLLARGDYVEPPSAKRMRTDNGRRKYEIAVEAKVRAARVRTLFLTSGLGIVVVLVSVIAIGVQANRADISGTLTSANATAATGVTIGKPAPVSVDVFEDFQCPVCKQFEAATSADLAARVKAGTVLVRYHPISLLDSAS